MSSPAIIPEIRLPPGIGLGLTLLGLVGGQLMAADTAPREVVTRPTRKDFHLFILAGQSNMAGRGEVEDIDREMPEHVYSLNKDEEWRPAVDPIHFDKKYAGVGPGRSFGLAVAEQCQGVSIGLIPTACGGSSITSWVPGGYHKQTLSHPYDDALARARRAMQDGVLCGILWHQGEQDCTPEGAASYEAALRALISRFRKDLGIPQLPFIIGQLGRFKGESWSPATKMVDAAHQAIADSVPLVAMVSSAGLRAKEDGIHFDAASQRRLGRRYAKVYMKMMGAVRSEAQSSSAESVQ